MYDLDCELFLRKYLVVNRYAFAWQFSFCILFLGTDSTSTNELLCLSHTPQLVYKTVAALVIDVT